MKKSELLQLIIKGYHQEVYNPDEEQVERYLQCINILDKILEAGIRPKDSDEWEKED